MATTTRSIAILGPVLLVPVRVLGTYCTVFTMRRPAQPLPVWSASAARDDKDKKIEELEFGSKEYFDFLAANPKLCRWLSVGSKVDFMENG